MPLAHLVWPVVALVGAAAPASASGSAEAGEGAAPGAPPGAVEAGGPSGGDDDEEAHGEGFEVFALPLYTQSPDTGPSVLGAASFYWHDGKTHPYKLWMSAVASASLYGVFSGLGYLEWVSPFDLPLRLVFSAGYQSSLAAHYCGVGNLVTCSEADAEHAADNLGLEGAARDDHLRRYFRYRFHGPVGTAYARWKMRDLPHKVELVAGVRSAYYVPGTLGFSGIDLRPYPGSLYANDHPRGEQGLANVVEIGAMADNRDEEASPTRGYWVEASLRSASALTLSRWTWGGANVTLRGYLPLRKHGALVLAERAVVDGMIGDVPTYELQRVGGSWAFAAFGGKDLGRGLREGRVMGRLKAISQTELRAKLWAFEVLGVPVDIFGVTFLDAAWVAVDWAELGGDPFRINWGMGAGLRVRILKNLLFRFELAFSGDEGWQPQPYIWPGFPF